MSRIFINYRRDDSAPYAGRLYDRLAAHFGDKQVFIDIDNIELGEDFAQTVARTVGTCDVLVAVIGKSWANVTDDRGRRRLDLDEDWVRMEIQHALERGIRVIPVLVGGAVMPSKNEIPPALAALSTRNALFLSDLSFRQDVGALIKAIQKAFDSTEAIAKLQTEGHSAHRETIGGAKDTSVSLPPPAVPTSTDPDTSRSRDADVVDVRATAAQRSGNSGIDSRSEAQSAADTVDIKSEPASRESAQPTTRFRWIRRLTIVQLVCGALLFLGGSYGVVTATFVPPACLAFLLVGVSCSIALGALSRRAGITRSVIQRWVVPVAIIIFWVAGLSYQQFEYPTSVETSRRVGIGLAFLSGAVLAVSAYLLLVNLRTLQRGSTYAATSSNE